MLSSQRVLCIRLLGELSPIDFDLLLDELCRFSPRISGRYPYLIFLEVSTTIPVFGNENIFLDEVTLFFRKQELPFFMGLAPSAPWAQVMSFCDHDVLWSESKLSSMPISYLLHLEGLAPFAETLNKGLHRVEHIVEFFEGMGFRTLSELLRLSVEAFRGRWHQIGERIYKSLHCHERQVISARVPQSALVAFQYCEHLVSDAALLLELLRRHLESLFKKLQKRGRFLRRVDVELYLEYSDKRVSVSVEPLSANRNLKLVLDLLDKKICAVSLANPVRQFELLIHEQSERVEQMNLFFETTVLPEKLERLLNIAHQEKIRLGFLKLNEDYRPESSFVIDSQAHSAAAKTSSRSQIQSKAQLPSPAASSRTALGIAPKEDYGRHFAMAPRPPLLLRRPLSVPVTLARRYYQKRLTDLEKIDGQWFNEDCSEKEYFYAFSSTGQMLWMYRDLHTDSFYIHGYWD